MLASVAARLALFAVISSQTLQLLQAAPFPGIENAAFTSQDLLAEESAPVQHYRHRRHHGDGSYHGHGHGHHKRHWDHHFPDPDCHHPQHGFGFEHSPHGPTPPYGPPPHRFEPHGFEPFPNTFGAPEYEEHQRPFKADLEPFKDVKGGSQVRPKESGPSSVAPPPAAPATSPSTTARTTRSTTTSTTAAPAQAPAPISSSSEEAAPAIDIRIG
ncbi:transcription factor Sox-1 [Drosophila gunungcola]|uniref:transcription factor Sox-1 n=1 Tax=Drosophila gunungcola TaxID=103775 RepID=UPI0022E78C57|nr:transcription factor Sox-1 [Drosophila gunungcola]